MKKASATRVIALLAALSAAVYVAQILLFRDPRDTFFYLMQDFAFLPVQVALVTVIAGKIIQDRERDRQIEKTRMLSGSFFSSVGIALLREIQPCVNVPSPAPLLQFGSDWNSSDFARAAAAVRDLKPAVSCGCETLVRLREILQNEKMPLLIISSNPVLLEHENFTDMLWSIFHLMDELQARPELSSLSEADSAHLNADVQRVLSAVLTNWVQHMAYLKAEYPYLFRLEAQRNPFLEPKTAD